MQGIRAYCKINVKLFDLVIFSIQNDVIGLKILKNYLAIYNHILVTWDQRWIWSI